MFDHRVTRLCMVVHGDYPLDPRVSREARAARRGGFEVDIVALRRPGEAAVEVIDGVRVFRLPFTHKRGVRAGGLLLEYFGFAIAASIFTARLTLRRRYDVVQVHNPPDFLIAAGLVPKLLGARLLFDVHDLSPDMFDMRFRGRHGARLLGQALRLVERAATAVADEVITVHEPYRRELVARGVRAAKTAVVMNSLDEHLVPGPRPGDCAEDGFRIVYHGSVTPHYGVDLLVEALALIRDQLPDARLEVYGEGDYIAQVRKRAAELGIAQCVWISESMLPQVEVLERIRGASVGVVPNRPTRLNQFALSSKLLEYVALGIPAVSADLPTIREHFGNDELFFFRAGDPESLGRTLVEVARDPEGARERATAARRRYEEYRWPVNAARYVAVLDRLAGHS